MPNRPGNIVVVGAGLAGLRSAETLRARGFDGRLTLVGEETRLPYERPALSKELLAGKRSPEQLTLRQPEFFSEQQIDLTLGRRVEKVFPERRTVQRAADRSDARPPSREGLSRAADGASLRRPRAGLGCARDRHRSTRSAPARARDAGRRPLPANS